MIGVPDVALIAGPTASGKSALALALANALRDAGRDAVIINADASQVYRDIPILSAQPSPAEQADVPHALVGHIDAAENYNAARWCDEARSAVDAAHMSGAIPILAGGTGLYIRTLINGIAPVPDIDPAIRAAIRGMAVTDAYAALTIDDPAAAARLAPADTSRVQRALEVMRSTGKPLSAWQADKVGGIGHRIRLAPLLLLPPRDWLAARCDARLSAMIAAGTLDEVATLLARQLDPAFPAMRAIGVPELALHLGGQMALADAVTAAQRATKQFAKRQYTFFRGQFPVDWPRHHDILNDDYSCDLVIKLRNSLLTR